MISINTKVLKYTLYIYYLVCFSKNSNNIKILINFSSKFNITTSAYTLKLGLQI